MCEQLLIPASAWGLAADGSTLAGDRGVQPVEVQAALRIAAVVSAVGRVLAVQSVDHPQNSGI